MGYRGKYERQKKSALQETPGKGEERGEERVLRPWDNLQRIFLYLIYVVVLFHLRKQFIKPEIRITRFLIRSIIDPSAFSNKRCLKMNFLLGGSKQSLRVCFLRHYVRF